MRDLAIGNLECVLGNAGHQLDKPYIFRGASDSPRFLKQHFDAVSLANNHSFDFGPEGLAEMLRTFASKMSDIVGLARTFGLLANRGLLNETAYRVAILGANEFRAENYAATQISLVTLPSTLLPSNPKSPRSSAIEVRYL